MKYYVFNHSNASPRDIERALAAVQKQVQEHVYPVWNVWVELIGICGGHEAVEVGRKVER